MYLYKKIDGSIVPAPAGFSPDAPDFDALAEVEEVLFVSKTYVKQLRLVVKPKEERDALRSALDPGEEERATSENGEADELQQASKRQYRSRSDTAAPEE